MDQEKNDSKSTEKNFKRKAEDGIEEDEKEEEISAVEYFQALNEEIEESNEAIMVIGNSDENICSFFNDKLFQRQPLYACLTCESNIDQTTNKPYPAGICYACSITCHYDHQLVELYTKRNFRCDCGSPIVKYKCKLQEKLNINSENKYNHNFSGLYCTCEKPYPCDEFEEEVMLQCVICEDWFHSIHLDVSPPPSYYEFICKDCVKHNDFLIYYKAAGSLDLSETDETVKEEQVWPEFIKALQKDKTKIVFRDVLYSTENDECFFDDMKKNFQEKYQTNNIEETDFCKSIYLPLQWRLKLCKCAGCKQNYEKNNIPFITDPFDMSGVYGYINTIEEDKRQENKFTFLQKQLINKGILDFKNAFWSMVHECSQRGDNLIKAEDISKFKEKLDSKRKRQNF